MNIFLIESCKFMLIVTKYVIPQFFPFIRIMPYMPAF